jgi:hypothetical protein
VLKVGNASGKSPPTRVVSLFQGIDCEITLSEDESRDIVSTSAEQAIANKIVAWGQ